MAKATTPKPHVTLDMKGSACPGPMLGAKRVLDELLAGEVMLLVSDCPSTRDDLLSWPKYADVEIVKTRKLARGATGYYIRKGKARRAKGGKGGCPRQSTIQYSAGQTWVDHRNLL